MRVRELTEAERPWPAERLVAEWGAVGVARLGELRDASVLPALVAEARLTVFGAARAPATLADGPVGPSARSSTDRASDYGSEG